MHDSFEKEVQKKMEELSLTPSAPVWEKVEMEIRPEKKRRRAFFWIPLLGLMLAGGFAYILFIDKKETSTSSTFIPSKNNLDTTSSNTNNISKVQSGTFKTITSFDPITKRESDRNGWQKERKFIPQTQPKLYFKEGKTNSSTTIITKDNMKTKVSIIAENDKKQKEQVIDTSTTTLTKTTEQKRLPINAVSKDEQGDAKRMLPIVTDSLAKTETKREQLIQEHKTDSAVKMKVARISKKWKKQLLFSVGRSSYQNSSNISNNALSFASPSTVTGGNTRLYNPQPTRGGTGFSIGFALSKDLSQKWKLSVGLQYAYYTTHTNVGDNKRNDTTVNYAMDKVAVDEFFTNTGTNNYTNRFAGVELPVTISYHPSIKLPLCFSIGAAYGRLLSTNALTYSEASNIYYKNKDNYLRNTLPVFTSLQVKLVSKKNVFVCFGPSVQYNLLKLRKENRYYTPHLIFAGIKTTINF
jgi:hypothetical protein